MRTLLSLLILTFLHAGVLFAQAPQPTLSPAVREFVSVDAPAVALTHVRVVDGTGAPPADGQTVLIENGRIAAVGATGRVRVPRGARVIELRGHTVIPGIVGMHNHTYYAYGGRSVQMWYTGPRLYLANGVTTIRTAGAQHPYAELNMKRGVEDGLVPGPRVHASGPYLTGLVGPGTPSHSLITEEDARRVVAYWAEEGATWLKASSTITRAVLGAAIDEAHQRGIRFTGHLCSVTFREAAALGIDNLEHGLITNSDHIPEKQPDVCPPDNMIRQVDVDLDGEEVQATYRDLIARNVAITSTLSVYEGFVPDRAPSDPRVQAALAPEAREALTQFRQDLQQGRGLVVPLRLLEKMMRWEREFVRRGGMLVAGVDPWGTGSLPGYGDQRNYELLVEAGFTPVEAIRVMTLNGAKLLREDHLYGSIEPGKLADLAILRGDPVRTPAEIRNVVLVFKDGIGYDSAKLIESVNGQVGIR
ncbi:MAG: amidohydrolase family protein [Longimicrobiaceae bacterium]